jgi:RNA polymerase sigma-70 factor (ECF subfamily)
MKHAADLTEDGLVRRMLAGDEEAFTLLYRRLHPSIYRFALHMSGSPSVAEDVTQEVFITLIREGKKFDAARGSLGSFLFGVARNFVRKRREQDHRFTPLGHDLDECSQTLHPFNGSGNGRPQHPGDIVISSELAGRVRLAVSSLPENYREVVVLCELEEMSYEKVAEILRCPVGTVRSRLHRARALLVEKLRENQPGQKETGMRKVAGK